jgi:hypothetical protein
LTIDGTPRLRQPGALVAALAWGVGTWAALGDVAPISAGSSARLGVLPPWWLLATLALGASALAGALRLDTRRAAPLYLALAALLPWWPGSIPTAFLVFAGPLGLLASAAGAGAVATTVLKRPVAAWPARKHLWAAWLLAFGLYLGSAVRLAPILPDGDEPHYLVITESLLYDGDLRIENNYRRADYLSFFGRYAKPDYLRRGLDGQIYSVHAPGLPALVLPAFVLGGYPGVVFFLALVGALGALLAWRAAYSLTSDTTAAWVGWASVILSIPFFFHAFTVFPDGMAAVLVMAVVWGLVRSPRPTLRSLAASGLALAMLPWLHSRFVTLAGGLGLVLAVRVLRPSGEGNRDTPAARLGRVALLASIPAVSTASWLWFFHAIYGRFDPRAPYGGATDMHLASVPVSLTGLLLDQQFGLIPNAPVYLIAIAGCLALWRAHRRLTVELAVALTPYVLAVSGFHMWWAGRSGPARFLVPVLLPMALPIAVWWRRHPSRTPRFATLALLGVSLALTASFAWVDSGALVYNARDGYALWLDQVAPSVNLARALPSSFQTGTTDVWGRAIAWGLTLAAAWLALRAAEARITPGGGWTLACGLTACGVLLVGPTVAWSAGGGPAVEPGAGQLHLLDRACGAKGLAVTLGPFAVRDLASLGNGARIPDASRRSLTADGPLWNGRDVPPGRYRVDIGSGPKASGVLRIALDRPDAVLLTCSFDMAPPGPSACEFDLPARAASLWLMPDAVLRQSDASIDLERLAPGPPESCGVTVGRAVSTPAGTLFVAGGPAYAESGGAWIGGGGDARLLIRPSADELRLGLRNGAAANTVRLQSGKWQVEWTLQPGESREVLVPRLGRDGTVPLGVQTSAGFRPFAVDPSSHDMRWLGVWVELR